MGTSFLYKLFLSTFGSMPARYDPKVDNWYGVILTELGILDPLREENISYLLVNLLGIVLFAVFLWALSLFNAYKNMRKQRDDAREDSTRSFYKCFDLHNQLEDTIHALHGANDMQQASDNYMNDERKKLRDSIQDLNDQHLVDEEEIRSLKQHVSNTECDRDEYGRRFDYASRESRRVAQENQDLVQKNQKLEREKQQLKALVAEKIEKLYNFQAHKNDTTMQPVAAVSSLPINIQPNDGKQNGRLQVCEQQNGTLIAEIEELRTDLEILHNEQGECSTHLQTNFAEKNDKMKTLRSEKKTVDEEPAEAINSLRVELGEKEQVIEDLEKANSGLVANLASSADNVQRLNTLSSELEVSRQAHAQCDDNSASQNSRMGELVTEKEQLEETLRIKNDECRTLQRRVTDLRNDQEELQKMYATRGEHASASILEMKELRNAIGSLQGTNNDLLQQLGSARNEHVSLIREGQRVEAQNQTLLNLRSQGQEENWSLRAQIETLGQTVNHQQQRILTLESNCPKCQNLKAALDAVVKDVEMSDDKSRAEMKREVAEELRSQVPDDLRRHLRGEVQHQLREEFKKHYSELLARNTKRIQDQESEIREKDAKLEKAKNNPTVNHAICKQRESDLQSIVTKMKQDAKIAQGNFSRLDSDAKYKREQLNRLQTDKENLGKELETIKADQRRAHHINPLQSRVAAFQRESERMKVDREKARNNCSVYSKNLSDLKKKYDALQIEHLALREKTSWNGDSPMELGRSEEPFALQFEQRTAASSNKTTIKTLQSEVTRLSRELEERRARDNVQNHNAFPGEQSLPVDEVEQQWPKGSFPDNQSSVTPAMKEDEIAALDLLRHEVRVRKARDGKAKEVNTTPAAPASPTPMKFEEVSSQSLPQDSDDEADDKTSLPIDGVEKSDDELEEGEVLDTKLAPKLASKPLRRFDRRLIRLSAQQPMTKPILGGGVGKKRERDEYSDGEADDSRMDDRKKVKIEWIEDAMRRLETSRDSMGPADKDIE